MTLHIPGPTVNECPQDMATPRPWRIGASGRIHAGEIGSGAIATVHHYGDDSRWLPNAELIVAAVNERADLLAALEAMLDAYGHEDNGPTRHARAVLARARGDT